MKKNIFITLLILLLGSTATMADNSFIPKTTQKNYQNNRYPLHGKPHIELPIGSIKPEGWLKEMLLRQRNGMTSQMDKLYPLVMGERNGWLGGDGDQWERGPYWIDGLLPLAYILDDKELKEKVQPWIEWTLSSQQPNGFFGPAKDYPGEPGIQRDNSHDWWPRIVMLKILQQYYSATQDQRVIDFMSNYFAYQLKTLPEKRLGHWSFWAEFRSADNLQAVYWLYNITGQPFLLELGKLIHAQSFSFVDMTNRGDLKRHRTIHCVNLAQGIKEPVIYYQQDTDPKYLNAVKNAFKDIRDFHGQPQGMYGGDEALHGNNPTQGSELCAAVELMYSLEKMNEITGDIEYADHLERIAFNALPTQISDDFMTKQYYQQPNQVCITHQRRNFEQEHEGTDILFGLLTGYPCCASNLHQGWPKFTQSLWYATPDGGLSAAVYSPSEVTAQVADNCTVQIGEETYYPMDDKITFIIRSIGNKKKEVAFPLHLRIPHWCKQADIYVNDKKYQSMGGGKVAVVHQNWKKGDKVVLHLPMEVSASTWHENSVAIERGPLVYALKMDEKWERKETENKAYGDYYYEVTSTTPWNYGLVEFDRNKANEVSVVKIDEEKQKNNFPWNVDNAPVEIKMKARTIPAWQLYNATAGPLPVSFCGLAAGEQKEITLIPYGCTTLRISEFPLVGR